jgi:hypothetical protein
MAAAASPGSARRGRNSPGSDCRMHRLPAPALGQARRTLPTRRRRMTAPPGRSPHRHRSGATGAHRAPHRACRCTRSPSYGGQSARARPSGAPRRRRARASRGPSGPARCPRRGTPPRPSPPRRHRRWGTRSALRPLGGRASRPPCRPPCRAAGSRRSAQMSRAAHAPSAGCRRWPWSGRGIGAALGCQRRRATFDRQDRARAVRAAGIVAGRARRLRG